MNQLGVGQYLVINGKRNAHVRHEYPADAIERRTAG